jgi:hypothetical protein
LSADFTGNTVFDETTDDTIMRETTFPVKRRYGSASYRQFGLASFTLG